MALSNLASWTEGKVTSACGASCGTTDKTEVKSSACGSACGAGDKK